MPVSLVFMANTGGIIRYQYYQWGTHFYLLIK